MFKHKKGWLEAVQALGYLLAVAIVLGVLVTCVSGCTGTSLSGRYTHHSSIPKYYDLHESNMVGPVLSVPICGWNRPYSQYCPVVDFSAQWDLRKGEHNRPYGTDPMGTINITQPIWIKK